MTDQLDDQARRYLDEQKQRYASAGRTQNDPASTPLPEADPEALVEIVRNRDAAAALRREQATK